MIYVLEFEKRSDNGLYLWSGLFSSLFIIVKGVYQL